MRWTMANPAHDTHNFGDTMTDYAAARLAMVDCQVRPSDVTAYPIIDALLTVKKEEFVPANRRSIAYAGDHIELAPGRVVLDGRTLGKMLDAIMIDADDLVLDLGCGMGYVAAVLGRLGATIVAVESDEDMAAAATEALANEQAFNVIVETGALASGAPDHGPYDAIFVEGAIETLPEAIEGQLKIGGRVVAIVVDGVVGQARVGVKTESGITWRRAFDATAPVLPGFEVEKAFEF